MNRLQLSFVSALVSTAALGCVNDADRTPIDEDVSSTEQAVYTTADCPVTPAAIAPPADQTIKRILHAAGVQRYRCDLTATGYAWTFIEPDADLLACNPVGSHYVGPTWEFKDGSIVTATKIAAANAPEALTSIPWLLLQANGHSGATGLFSNVTYIQRLSTGGGIAPAASACDATTAGTFANAPYTADYVFYRHPVDPTVATVRCGAP